VLGISLNVFFRYVLEKNFFGMEEVIVIFAFWLYFIGGSYGTYERSHISADLTSVYIKNEKFLALIKAFISLITLFLSLLFTYWAIEFFMWGLQHPSKSPSLQIPTIIPQSSIFFGFILMSLYLTVHFIRDTIDIFTPTKISNE